MAFDARDHLGVNVRSAASAYAEVGLFKNFLSFLGVKWVRDDNPNGASVLSGYNVQTVITATDSTTAVTQTNTAITAGTKAIELVNEPPTVGIMYGASIGGLSGALKLSDEQTKFGKLPVVRSFSAGFMNAVPTGLDSSQIWHHSFKGVGSNFTAMSAGTWDAQIRTWLQSLPAWLNLWFTYYHEPEDNWTSANGSSPAAYATAQAHFYNLVRTCPNVKANVKVLPVFTAYILGHGKGAITGGNSIYDINTFWPAGPAPDMVGFDFDGVTNTTSYFDWQGIGYMDWAETFAVSKGIPWIVPEFAGNVLTNGTDSSHSGRTAYVNAQAAGFATRPNCLAVEWWDDSSSVLTTANETTAWKNLVAQSAPMLAAQQINLAVITAVNGRVPVVASALADGTSNRNATLWGLVQGKHGITEGNLHLYRENRNDTDWTTHRTAGYALPPLTTKGLTYQVSETGYHDDASTGNTDDTTTSTQIVPDFQQLIADGATKVFFYEAIDEDLAFPASPDGFFGLAADDWTPKPQAVALQAYLASFVTGPTAPLAPTSVIAMAGDTIADVTWTVSPAGTAADTFTVTPSPADVPAQTIIAPTKVAVFAGLTNGTSYTFTVAANNAQGSSTAIASNAVTPAVASSGGGGTGIPATGGGGIGSIAPIVKTPFPASYPTPVADNNPNVGKSGQQLVGQVQQLFLYDPNTADLLQIVPNQSGIWLNDMETGYPVVREVTASNPGRNGEYDQTQFFGARAITLSLTVMQAPDMTGAMQPASYWLEILRSWVADPSNRFRLGFQMLGQRQRFATVRASDASGPFIGSGVGRSSISVQLTLRSPDGLLYEQNPLPNDLAVLRNGVLIGDGRFESIIPQAVAGSGLTPPLVPPLVFPVQSTGTVNVPYKGTARSAPEIRIVGACTDPSISALNPDGTVRGQLSFTGLTLAGTDELRLDLSAKTAIRLASGAVSSNVRQYLTTWSWFDLLPDTTGTMNRLKFTVGSGTATAKTYYLNAFV